jgi:exopolysaccharide biosynthesis polyprenyl glycosylphosphotransferase
MIPVHSRRVTALLVGLDAAAFVIVWLGFYALRDWLGDSSPWLGPINPIDAYLLALMVYLPFWSIVVWYHGLYDHAEKVTGINELSRILKAFLAGLIGSLAMAYMVKSWDLGRFIILGASAGYFLWLYASRSALRLWKSDQIRRGRGVVRVAIIGVGRTARRVAERILDHPEGGYELVGFVDPHPRRRLDRLAGFPVLGKTSDLPTLVKEHMVKEVFLAVPKLPQHETLGLVLDCEHLGVQFKIVSNLFQVITRQVQVDVVDEVPVVRLRNAEIRPIHAFMKRLLDLTVASGLLLLFAIPMLLIWLFIRLESKGPALFRQVRIGQGGEPFEMLKFRTMYTDAPKYAVAPTDPQDPRVTPSGRWLRKTSLDELPQLFNVLLGQMSMVGPRPEMPFLVDQYEEWQRRRLDVKPGVTGLWQVVGRKNLPLSRNMEYDFYYIMNQSIFMDLVILMKTVPAVIFGRGAF